MLICCSHSLPYYSLPSPMSHTPNFCIANYMFQLRNKKCSKTGPNRRCSGLKQYQKRFRYYPYCTCAFIVTSLGQMTPISSAECSCRSPSSGSLWMNTTPQRGSSSAANNTTQFVIGCKWLRYCGDCGVGGCISSTLTRTGPAWTTSGEGGYRMVAGYDTEVGLPAIFPFIRHIDVCPIRPHRFTWLQPQRSLVYVMCNYEMSVTTVTAGAHICNIYCYSTAAMSQTKQCMTCPPTSSLHYLRHLSLIS